MIWQVTNVAYAAKQWAVSGVDLASGMVSPAYPSFGHGREFEVIEGASL
jgi:hypothetical protein